MKIYSSVDMTLPYAAGALYSTVEDLYKWDQALYTEQLVKTATFEEAINPGRLNDNSFTDYGFGWGLGTVLGRDATYHNGSWAGFRIYILRFRTERFTVVLLANVEELDAGLITEEISKIYLGDKVTRQTKTKLPR